MIDHQLYSLLEGLVAVDIADGVSAFYSHKSHILGLSSPDPSKILFGPAVTISFLPVRQDVMNLEKDRFGSFFYQAIGDEDPTGKVLVMASNGHPGTSLAGGTKLSRLENNKMAGLLCDGSLRDFDEIAVYEMAVYCQGETMPSGRKTVQPYFANMPVVIHGVTIFPGDYVYADRIGAVIIPGQDVKKVLQKAHEILDQDRQTREAITTEKPSEILMQQ